MYETKCKMKIEPQNPTLKKTHSCIDIVIMILYIIPHVNVLTHTGKSISVYYKEHLDLKVYSSSYNCVHTRIPIKSRLYIWREYDWDDNIESYLRGSKLSASSSLGISIIQFEKSISYYIG